MSRWRLVCRSVVFFRRSHMAVMLGVVVGTAVLVGALVVGDSVRYSLEQMALSRLGKVQLALVSEDRFFVADLSRRLAADLAGPGEVPEENPRAEVAPVLLLPAVASMQENDTRANQVQLVGTDERFWHLALRAGTAVPEADQVLLNRRLARQLGVEAGQEIVLRLRKPSSLPYDMVLASKTEQPLALSVKVTAVVSDESFGRFGLQVSQIPPYNAFVSLDWLSSQVGLKGRANVLLVGAGKRAPTFDQANAAIRRSWRLADAELELLEPVGQQVLELRSRRIFIDDPVVEALVAEEDLADRSLGILTYFVNEIRLGDQATPYSMITAIGPLGKAASGPALDPLPEDLQAGEIVINRWLADDLGAKVEDAIDLRYFVLDSEEQLPVDSPRESLRVRAIVPMVGLANDRELMPAYPGIADAESTSNWQPGIPIDLDRIQPEDEAYWHEHRGTPKAFVSLEAGQQWWRNRFGGLTAIRLDRRAVTVEDLERRLLKRLDPAVVGLAFHDVRLPALAATAQALDFGGLFVALSIFLVIAALLLTGLLFVFGIEQRTAEVGTLLALGFRPAEVRWLMLGEGMVLAAVGALIGALAGLGYTKLVLVALASVWRDAIASGSIQWHANSGTLLSGAVVSFVLWFLAMGWTLRRQFRRPARELLAAGSSIQVEVLPATLSRWPTVLAALCAAGAVVTVMLAGGKGAQAAVGAFFGSGSLLLVAGLLLCRRLLHAMARRPSGLSGWSLAFGSAARRRSRSLATVSLMACGVFMVVAVGAFHRGPQTDSTHRRSGTGGFALFGQTQLPVLHDLNDARGRAAEGLREVELAGVEFVALRVRDGDDASCLNLNRAQRPRLIGVDPKALASRGAFEIISTLDSVAGMQAAARGWLLLDEPLDDGAVPAFTDHATVTWALGAKVGKRLAYTDERGNLFHVRIVGVLSDSILQGNLIISQRRFTERFGSASGSRMFLIDAPQERSKALVSALGTAFGDYGMELATTSDRLGEFNAVTNTYLAIFQALGALALVLGSVGLGVVVLRNVLERRSEFALLRAVGFASRSLRWLVFGEHGLLLTLGILIGLFSAAVAVAPAFVAAQGGLASAVVMIVVVLFAGAAWVWLAAGFALRGSMLETLQDE